MTKRITNIFLAILLISTVIGGGVYLSLGKKLPALLPKTQPAQKLVEIQVASWKTYQNKDFSFKYPADWQIATSQAKLSVGTFTTETVTNVTMPDVPLASSAGTRLTPPDGAIITIQTIPVATTAANLFSSSQFTPTSPITIGSTRIQPYTLKQSGAAKNFLILPFKNYTISLDYYDYQHPGWDYLQLLGQVINSLKINEK